MFDDSIDHWYLLLVEMAASKAWVLDSLPGTSRPNRLGACLAVVSHLASKMFLLYLDCLLQLQGQVLNFRFIVTLNSVTN